MTIDKKTRPRPKIDHAWPKDECWSRSKRALWPVASGQSQDQWRMIWDITSLLADSPFLAKRESGYRKNGCPSNHEKEDITETQSSVLIFVTRMGSVLVRCGSWHCFYQGDCGFRKISKYDSTCTTRPETLLCNPMFLLKSQSRIPPTKNLFARLVAELAEQFVADPL